MAKKKAGRKPGKKVNLTPKLDCPHTAELMLSHTAESTGTLATKFSEFLVTKAAWVVSVRAHYADGGKKADVPVFAASKFPNPNTGRMSRKLKEVLVAEYNNALDAGKKLPSFPATYNPVELDLLHDMNGTSILRSGVVSKHPKPPKDWDDKRYGPWHNLDENNERTIASGWFFDKKPLRRCHAENLLTRIDDPDKNVIEVGKVRYVVGTGGHDGSAVFLIHAHKGGNYGACDEARKRMSLAGVKGITNLVFKFEDKPNLGGAFRIKATWKDVNELCFMPRQVLTAGYLTNGNGPLTPAQIRKLGDDTKGIRFAPLTEDIIGKDVPWKGDKGLWIEVQRIQGSGELKKQREREGRGEAEGTTPQSKSIRNINVECRCDPSERTPFGLRAVQLHVVPYVVATGNGNIEAGEFSMGVVIGARSNYEYCVGVNEAKREEAAEIEAEPKAPKPKVTKPKVTKPKTEATKPKTPKKPKATKATDAAPPIEADIADEESVEVAAAEDAEVATAEAELGE